MRYATVVASAYEDSPRLAPLPSSVEGARGVEQGLTRLDFGWVVESMPADRDMPERLEAALRALPEPPEVFVVSFHGYLAWVGERPPALLLSGPKPRAFPVRRFCSLLDVWSDQALVIFDVTPVVDRGKSTGAIGDALRSAIDGLRVGMLLGARVDPQAPTPPGSSFGELLSEGLTRFASSFSDTRVSARDLYRVLRDRQSNDSGWRIRYFPVGHDVTLAPPRPEPLRKPEPTEPSRPAPSQPVPRSEPSQPVPRLAPSQPVPAKPAPSQPVAAKPAPSQPVAAKPAPSQPVPRSEPKQALHAVRPIQLAPSAPSAPPEPARQPSRPAEPSAVAPSVRPGFDPFAAAAKAFEELYPGARPAEEPAPPPEPATPLPPAVAVEPEAGPEPVTQQPGEPPDSARSSGDDEDSLWLGTAVGFFGPEYGGAAPWAFLPESAPADSPRAAPAAPSPPEPARDPDPEPAPPAPAQAAPTPEWSVYPPPAASVPAAPVPAAPAPAEAAPPVEWSQYPPPASVPPAAFFDATDIVTEDDISSIEAPPEPEPAAEPKAKEVESAPSPPEPPAASAAEAPPAPARPAEAPVVAAPAEPVPPPPPPNEEDIGDQLAAEDHLEPALEHYKSAVLQLDDERVLDRSRLFAKLGDVERRLGQEEVSLYHYSEALRLDPLNLSALFWATEVLYDRQQYERVESLLQQRLDALTDTGARVEVLRAMVALWLDDHRDLTRARFFLDRILLEQPEDQLALESLVEVQEAQGDHEEAIRTRWWLASLCAEDRGRHARLLVEAARAAHRYLGDAAYAVDLGEQALSADPTAYEALELIAGLLVETEDWEHLARTYRAMLEVHRDDWVALDLCEKLATVYRDKLGELGRAAEALERALGLDPTNARIRLQAADAYARMGNRTGALIHCRMVMRDQPEAAEAYRLAYQVFSQLGEPDPAWLAASALEYLGQAEPEQTLLAETHRPEGLLQPKNVLTDEDWDGGLFWPEHDPALGRLLKLVKDAAIEHRLAALGREQRLLTLDPGFLQDPSVSTTMLCRSMVWASRLLGTKVPALYVYPSVPGELGATPARELTVLASRALGSGFTLSELAFLWARQLTSLRGEHLLLLFYPTVGQLAELVTAAFVARDFTPRRADFFDANVSSLADALRHHLGEAGLEELGQVADEVGTSEAGSRMVRWARGVELVSARVALLAVGEISIAAELTRRFPVGGQTTPEEQRRELLTFSLSEEYFELRRRLGVAVEKF